MPNLTASDQRNMTPTATNDKPSLNDAEKVRRNRAAPPGKKSAELVKYVFVEIDVARENHREFQEKMAELAELMFDHKRWELVFASYPITGPVSRFVHIWKIPDESTLVEIMREGALDLPEGEGPEAGSLEATFRDRYLEVQKLIKNTEHRLLTALPYDPTHVGVQSQTILIDAGGEAFLIDHGELRRAAEDPQTSGVTDIASQLEYVRRVKFTRRDRSNTARPRDPAPLKPALPAGAETVSERSLMELQLHLNRGSTSASLTFEAQQALLFNLAGLKAKSVYQNVEFPEPAEGSLATLGEIPTEDQSTDIEVQRLLIAMPWGGIYDLQAAALHKLATPLAKARPDVRAATYQALAPLEAGRVSVAAIPEERDDTVGDGCACFVINLQSFVSAKCRTNQRKSIPEKMKR